MNDKIFVFDTNSLISALIIPSSVSKAAFKKADEYGILVFSTETLLELSEVLLRSKFDKYVSINDRLEYVKRLETIGKLIQPISNFTDCRDPKDNKFLNLAYDAKASFIVTGDQDLLILNPFYNIPILSPASFLNRE